MTNKLNILIRRIDAGDSKVTYHEFGSEIFKNYKDSSDATHFSRGEKLEPFNLMKRAKSPEVRVNTGTGRSHIYRNFLAGYATIIGCNRVADASTVNRYANEAQFVPSFTAKQLHITPGAVFPNAIIQNNRYEIIVL